MCEIFTKRSCIYVYVYTYIKLIYAYKQEYYIIIIQVKRIIIKIDTICAAILFYNYYKTMDSILKTFDIN